MTKHEARRFRSFLSQYNLVRNTRIDAYFTGRFYIYPEILSRYDLLTDKLDIIYLNPFMLENKRIIPLKDVRKIDLTIRLNGEYKDFAHYSY